MVVSNSGIKIAIVNSIHFLSVEILALEFIKCISKRIPTFLIQNPCVFFVDKVVVKFHQMSDSRTVSKLFFGRSFELKEVSAEPNLFYMSLVTALCYYLLYCILFLTFFVLT